MCTDTWPKSKYVSKAFINRTAALVFLLRSMRAGARQAGESTRHRYIINADSE